MFKNLSSIQLELKVGISKLVRRFFSGIIHIAPELVIKWYVTVNSTQALEIILC